MKRACSTWGALYVVCALLVGHIVYRRFPVFVAVVAGGAIGGGIVWMGLAYIAGVRTKIVEAMRLWRSDEGPPPQDGETISVRGTVEPVSSTIASPLTGQPCVAYKYDVRRGEALLYDGIACVPAAVHTMHGQIRIFAYPTLQVTPREVPDAQIVFEEYAASASFAKPDFNFAHALGAFDEAKGSMRRDTRYAEDDLSRATFKEWRLAPGDQVVATGRYSLERGGLVAEPGMPLSLSIREASQSGAGRSIAGAFGSLIGGILFLAVAAAALVGLYAFVPLSAAEQMSPTLRRTWREVRLERTIDRRVRPMLRKAGLLDSGIPSAMLDRGTARGRINANGRDVDVSRASASRLGEMIVVRIDDDAAVLTLGPGGRPLRLRFGNDDVDAATFARDLEVEITSSTHYGEIAGRFTYFRDDAESPVARVTFHAALQ